MSGMNAAAPPKPPTNDCGRESGGDGDGMMLAQVQSSERRAILSVWKWQHEECRHEPRPSTPVDLEDMIRWDGDHSTAGPLSHLRGRSLAARLGENILAIVLISYELDKSSLLSALSNKHTMVVEAITYSPELSGTGDASFRNRVLVDAGLRSALLELARAHEMRIEFSYTLEHG
jgi:hypothetical protein